MSVHHLGLKQAAANYFVTVHHLGLKQAAANSSKCRTTLSGNELTEYEWSWLINVLCVLPVLRVDPVKEGSNGNLRTKVR